MERFGLRDDQWDRINDILPDREGHVGGTAPALKKRRRPSYRSVARRVDDEITPSSKHWAILPI
jgi:hypothetical protein